MLCELTHRCPLSCPYCSNPVELELKVNKVSYKIIRGAKPNIFEIYKEDELLIQDASLRDYQQKLLLKIAPVGVVR